MLGTANRLTVAIEKVQAQIDAKLDETSAKALGDTLAVTFDEHFRFQELQAQAHVMQNLSTDEAQVVYIALGEVGSPSNGGWAADTSLATKVVVTQLMGELLAKKLA